MLLEVGFQEEEEGGSVEETNTVSFRSGQSGGHDLGVPGGALEDGAGYEELEAVLEGGGLGLEASEEGLGRGLGGAIEVHPAPDVRKLAAVETDEFEGIGSGLDQEAVGGELGVGVEAAIADRGAEALNEETGEGGVVVLEGEAIDVGSGGPAVGKVGVEPRGGEHPGVEVTDAAIAAEKAVGGGGK